MLNVIEIKDFNAPELDIYARCTEARLLNKDHPEEGMFIAESPKVIGRALDAGYEPLSVLVEKKQITNSYAGILLPALFNAYGIFLFRQFYMSFPADLEEAAKLDGCSTYRMFFTIIFPLSRPIIIPLSIADYDCTADENSCFA